MKDIASRLAIVLAVCLAAHHVVRAASNADTINGTWRTTESVPLGPYVVTIKTNGSTLTGEVRQTEGPQPGPSSIYDGKIERANVTFKANSPDGHRVVTFSGVVGAKEISFTRRVRVLDGGVPGANGLFGVDGLAMFVVRRSD